MSESKRPARAAAVEAAAVASGGGALAALVGWPLGIALPAAALGAANGALGGWRGIYEWRRARGWLAAALDSTWGLPMTTASLFAHVAGRIRGEPGFVPDLSVRQNRHVYRRGFQPRGGFAITLGNVINGAGDVSRPRRRRLITDHEDVHCWQARWWGPLFPVLYVGWAAAGAVGGAAIWLTRRRSERFGKVVESSAYYLNPFEWWAYSRDDHWPPGGKIVDFGWARPCCRPLAAVRNPETGRRSRSAGSPVPR
ncbi:MAG: hypothetical protein AAF945_21145 [Actinomycetota bacterium]